MNTTVTPAEVVIQLDKVSTRFGAHVVHTDVTLEVRRQEIFAVIGGSGSGKSTLLREMILLQRPYGGTIKVLGVDLAGITDDAALALRQRWGVMFQHGGLFGALTVLEAMAAEGVRLFVFSSTCATYGEPVETPISESHPQRPINSYGESKLAVERALPHFERPDAFFARCDAFFAAA